MIYKKNLVLALNQVGYNSSYIRKNKLFSESTMTKFRNGNTKVTIENLETVCKLLNCQPGDILEYVSDDIDTSNSEIIT